MMSKQTLLMFFHAAGTMDHRDAGQNEKRLWANKSPWILNPFMSLHHLPFICCMTFAFLICICLCCSFVRRPFGDPPAGDSFGRALSVHCSARSRGWGRGSQRRRGGQDGGREVALTCVGAESRGSDAQDNKTDKEKRGETERRERLACRSPLKS